MTKAFDKIAGGLTEAIDFAQGKETGARVHQVEVPVQPIHPVRPEMKPMN
jgi:putative transcriptional regulator